jgi:hypothetical protein
MLQIAITSISVLFRRWSDVEFQITLCVCVRERDIIAMRCVEHTMGVTTDVSLLPMYFINKLGTTFSITSLSFHRLVVGTIQTQGRIHGDLW